MAYVQLYLKYLSTTRDRTGRREQVLQLPAGARLQDLFDRLSEIYSFILPEPGIMVIVNGRGWSQLSKRLEHELSDGDVICLAPLVDGG
jgi:molybdopterin converting factor small subunit